MDKIKIKDAALEQGMKPEELVARLREAGIPLHSLAIIESADENGFVFREE